MSVSIPRTPIDGGGWWEDPDTHRPMLRCPTCRGPLSIANHEIDSQGNVSPSVVCTNTRKRCPFHNVVRLLGYVRNQPAPRSD